MLDLLSYTFTVSIATTKHLLQRMDEEKSNFSNPNELIIELKQLTPLLIVKATTLYYFEII